MYTLNDKLTRVEKAKIVFTEILEKRDFSWIDKIFSEYYGIREGDENKLDKSERKGAGKLGVKLYLSTFIQAFENVKYTFLNTLECEQQVVFRWRITAKHVKELFSIQATQKNVNVIGVSWFFFDQDELIRNIYLIWNGFSLIDQLELELRPKEQK